MKPGFVWQITQSFLKLRVTPSVIGWPATNPQDVNKLNVKKPNNNTIMSHKKKLNVRKLETRGRKLKNKKPNVEKLKMSYH